MSKKRKKIKIPRPRRQLWGSQANRENGVWNQKPRRPNYGYSIKELPTTAFRYKAMDMEVGAVNGGNAYVEYGGAHVATVEVCL